MRDAFRRQAWSEAFTAIANVDDADSLDAEDLERLPVPTAPPSVRSPRGGLELPVNAISTRIGDVDVLVETPSSPGTELTAKLDAAAERVTDVFLRARAAIVQMAVATAAMIDEAASEGADPTTLEVEFGLAFSAVGDIIVCKAASEASLKVTLTFSGRR